MAASLARLTCLVRSLQGRYRISSSCRAIARGVRAAVGAALTVGASHAPPSGGATLNSQQRESVLGAAPKHGDVMLGVDAPAVIWGPNPDDFLQHFAAPVHLRPGDDVLLPET